MSVVKTVVTVAVATAVRALGIALIVWTAPVAAATLTAASCSYSDVNANVGAAVDGDTVVVPAGNCAWNGGLAISKAITLKGAGIGQTFITNNNSTGHLITITESTTGNIRVQGFDFSAGTGPLQVCSGPCFFAQVNFTTNGKPVVITANKFWLAGGANALGVKTNRGVISGNTFLGTPSGGNCNNNAAALRHKPSGLPWATPSTFGGADVNGDQNLYFESNVMTDVFEGLDVDDSGRLVVRYNTITNSGTLTHGVDTSAVGGRYIDIHNNTLVWDSAVKCPPDLPSNVYSFISLRGGTALIHDNVIPNVTSQAWGDAQEIHFALEELRRNAGSYACWTGGYPAPRQTGWGFVTGATQAGTTGVFQDREPVYLWNNTGGGNYNSPAVDEYYPNDCGSSQSAVEYIQSGREYFTSTAKPGYTPFTYPHPLTGSQSTSISRPPTNLNLQ